MSIRWAAVIVLSVGPYAVGGVFSYECDSFPEQAGWEVGQIVCDPDLWLAEGWFFLNVRLCAGYPPPNGQSASYKRSLSEYVGEPLFFLEWRVESDANRSEIIWGGGADLSAGSTGGVNYHFRIAADQVRFLRDNQLPISYIDIEPGVPHTYRLELCGDQLYICYIDSEIVDAGLPEGAYPSSNPTIGFRTRSAWLPNTTKWDYIRYGVIPQPASGDFDSDGDVDSEDLYFFNDCLLGPDADGPGCSWADMNGDGITDGADIALFVDALLAPPQPTRGGPGVRSVSFDGRAAD